MPHITAQYLVADTIRASRGHAAEHGKSEQDRKNENPNTPGIRLDLGGLSTKSLLALPDARSSSNRSPQTQNLDMFPIPTPTSTRSAIFDSPRKSSPSSSVSSTNLLSVMQRVHTPVAELEDTSLAYVCPELEDTSEYVIRSRGGRSLSSYTVKSTYPTARSLVSAVDQQFADYEAEIRFLRNNIADAQKSLREVRKSLYEAKEAADDSSRALDAAQEAISDRDYDIEIKKNVIAELEKEVRHCQSHHTPPTPPSKLRGSDRAVSRFNVDATRFPNSSESNKSAATLSPSLIGRSYAASPKTSSDGSSTVSGPKTPRSTFIPPSSGAPSPLAAGSPFPQSHHRSYSPRAISHTPLTAEALAIALSSAAGPSKSPGEAVYFQSPDVPYIRKGSLEQISEATKYKSTASTTSKPHRRSGRPMPPATSTTNLRDAQNSFPRSDPPALPPRLPMMSGGLGIVEGLGNETQDQKLRKKRAALGDLFRRKDSGFPAEDDMVRPKDQVGTVMNDMVHALDYCGI